MIQRVDLRCIRPYTHTTLELSPNINVLMGLNGVGKTTLLEAVHTLSTTRSYKTTKLSDLIQNNQPAGKIVIETGEQQLSLEIRLRKNNFQINQDRVAKQSNFVGQYHVITLAPEHGALIAGAKKTRQQFIDTIATVENKTFLQARKDLEKVNNQKRALLQQDLSKTQYMDLVAPWNQQQQALSLIIRDARRLVLQAMQQTVETHYQTISQTSQSVDLHYVISDGADDWSSQQKEREYYAKRVLLGAQRDDLLISINNQLAKKDASQGEKASILLSMKLAELDYVLQHTDQNPIFLLDDIGMTLDEQRRTQLFDKINANQYQTLITTCDSHITEKLRQHDAVIYEAVQKSSKVFWQASR